MALQDNLKKLHLCLSRDLECALMKENIDKGYVYVLFITHLLSIGSLFLTDGPAGHIILIYILIPTLLFPARFSLISFGKIVIPIPTKLSYYNIFRNTILCRTPLFLAVVLYCVDKAFLSYLYPEPELGYLRIFFYYLLAPLLAFIIASIRLASDYPNFYYLFFRIISPLAALNAMFNIASFMKTIPALSFLGSYRLQSTFGAAMGYNPNLDALIHAVFLTGLVITVASSSFKFDFLFSSVSIIILFCALILEQSRGCLLAVTITITLFIVLRRPFIHSKFFYSATFFLILLLIYILYVLPNGISTYLSRPNYLRPEIWLRFYDIAKDNSFIGLGDRFTFAINLSNGEIAPHPHNILLSSLVRGGIIGLISILYILSMGLLRSYEYLKQTQNAVPFCVFLTVTIAGMFDFDIKIWQSGWYLAGYWLAISFVLGADSSLQNEDIKRD